MHNLCNKPVVKRTLKRETVAKTILQKITKKTKRILLVMMTAAQRALHVFLLLKLRFQKIYVWNYLITKPIRIPTSSIQILIFQTV